jgi:hypothetical protein
MKNYLAIIILLLTVYLLIAAQKDSNASHPNYVPDSKTAVLIAEAVLIGQFGQERVDAQRPYAAISMDKDFWLVQGLAMDENGIPKMGGTFGVIINKHEGCVKVIEKTK